MKCKGRKLKKDLFLNFIIKIMKFFERKMVKVYYNVSYTCEKIDDDDDDAPSKMMLTTTETRTSPTITMCFVDEFWDECGELALLLNIGFAIALVSFSPDLCLEHGNVVGAIF